jgi:hypothetical protein
MVVGFLSPSLFLPLPPGRRPPLRRCSFRVHSHSTHSHSTHSYSCSKIINPCPSTYLFIYLFIYFLFLPSLLAAAAAAAVADCSRRGGSRRDRTSLIQSSSFCRSASCCFLWLGVGVGVGVRRGGEIFDLCCFVLFCFWLWLWWGEGWRLILGEFWRFWTRRKMGGDLVMMGYGDGVGVMMRGF